MQWIGAALHLATVKSKTNTCGIRAHISPNKKNKGYFFLLLPEMCILLSHGCLMLLVAVPPLSLFRQLEASSRRESWYLCWGFRTDHEQEELSSGRRQPATDTNFHSWHFGGKTDRLRQWFSDSNRWGFLFCIPRAMAGCVTNRSTNTHIFHGPPPDTPLFFFFPIDLERCSISV